jgi:pimeloyl-ACP methyl ester carboxylesterase
MPGRGRSDWLDDPQLYGFPFYLSVLGALFARLDAASVHWVGTSMGGLLGMLFASLPNSPVRCLVLNDVGPVIAKEGMARIAETVGRDPGFANRQELDAYLRQTYAGFGPLSEAQWRHLLAHSGRTRNDGKLGLAYDPKIGEALRAADGQPMQDTNFWAFYDHIRVPTLVLRGAESDILRAADAAEMQRRGPRAELVEFAHVGHAPALMAEDQIGAIRTFLLGD